MRTSNGLSSVGRLARDARLALRRGPHGLPPRRLMRRVAGVGDAVWFLESGRPADDVRNELAKGFHLLALLPGEAPGTPRQDLYVLRKSAA